MASSGNDEEQEQIQVNEDARAYSSVPTNNQANQCQSISLFGKAGCNELASINADGAAAPSPQVPSLNQSLPSNHAECERLASKNQCFDDNKDTASVNAAGAAARSLQCGSIEGGGQYGAGESANIEARPGPRHADINDPAVRKQVYEGYRAYLQSQKEKK